MGANSVPKSAGVSPACVEHTPLGSASCYLSLNDPENPSAKPAGILALYFEATAGGQVRPTPPMQTDRAGNTRRATGICSGSAASALLRICLGGRKSPVSLS
jgi:hypothetical protein